MQMLQKRYKESSDSAQEVTNDPNHAMAKGIAFAVNFNMTSLIFWQPYTFTLAKNFKGGIAYLHKLKSISLYNLRHISIGGQCNIFLFSYFRHCLQFKQINLTVNLLILFMHKVTS